MVEWKKVPERYGPYEASNCGSVRNSLTGETLKQNLIGYYGTYRYVRLSPDGVDRIRRGRRRLVVLVARLVLETFVGPCPDGMECCHEDDNPTNNRLGNLRWDTKSANAYDRYRNGDCRQGERNGYAKLTDEKVIEARRLRKLGWSYGDLTRRYGLKSDATVRMAVSGRTWRHLK